MKHEISENRRSLTVTLDPDEQQELNEAIEGMEHPRLEEVLESLVCNSELDWIDPTETGDLTDAPMIGIRDYDDTGGPTDLGSVLERWAFMNYQVEDPVAVLAETGRLVFIC
jgi:hypothetical protein